MTATRSLVTESDLDQLTALFRLLSDKTRLNILLLLAEGERNVTWLCNELKLPQPTISHHLGLLRLHNILANRRSGKQIFYTLDGRVDHANEQGLSIHTERFVVRIATSSRNFGGVTVLPTEDTDRTLMAMASEN